jgi:hypothetical protein
MNSRKIVDELLENKLSSASRKRMKSGSFALPGERKYPIGDISHARNALARVSANGTSSEKKRVRAAVHSKYPSLAKESMVEHDETDTNGPEERREVEIGRHLVELASIFPHGHRHHDIGVVIASLGNELIDMHKKPDEQPAA